MTRSGYPSMIFGSLYFEPPLLCPTMLLEISLIPTYDISDL